MEKHVRLKIEEKEQLLKYVMEYLKPIREILSEDYLINMLPYKDVAILLKRPGIYSSDLASSDFVYDGNRLTFRMCNMEFQINTLTKEIFCCDDKMYEIRELVKFIDNYKYLFLKVQNSLHRIPDVDINIYKLDINFSFRVCPQNNALTMRISIEKNNTYEMSLDLKEMKNAIFQSDDYLMYYYRKISAELLNPTKEKIKDIYLKKELEKEREINRLCNLPAYGNYLPCVILRLVQESGCISDKGISSNLRKKRKENGIIKNIPESGMLGYFTENDVLNAVKMLYDCGLLKKNSDKTYSVTTLYDEFLTLPGVRKKQHEFKDFTDLEWKNFLDDYEYYDEYGDELFYIPGDWGAVDTELTLEQHEKMKKVDIEQMQVLHNKYIVRTCTDALSFIVHQKPENTMNIWREYAETMCEISDGREKKHWQFVLTHIFFETSRKNI